MKVIDVILLGGLTAMLAAACDLTDYQTSTRDALEEVSLGPPATQLSSRVFDGRDSLTTGDSGPTATKNNFTIVTQFLEIEGDDDVGRVGITDPDNLDASILLYESREGNPILTPGGDQVTWGTFSGAKGAITVKCTNKGTHVSVHLAGLIPTGIYTIQNELSEPGTGEMLGQVGFTGVNGSSATNSSFRASAGGEGHISGFVKPGALEMGLVGGCLLDEARKDGLYDWRTTAIYQMDGTPDMGGEGTFVEQAGFLFVKESLPVKVR